MEWGLFGQLESSIASSGYKVLLSFALFLPIRGRRFGRAILVRFCILAFTFILFITQDNQIPNNSTIVLVSGSIAKDILRSLSP